MINIIEDTKEFVDKNGWKEAFQKLDNEGKENFIEFRLGLIIEETQELFRATRNKDAEEVVDALMDITVTAMVKAYILDIDIEKAWNEVKRANMSKIKGPKEGRNNPFNMPDADKPEGWKAPNHEGNHGAMKELWKDKKPQLIQGHEVYDIETLKAAFKHNNAIIDKHETIELIGVSFKADQEAIYGTVNPTYVASEERFYMTEEQNVKVLADIHGFIPEAWKKTMNENGDINSNYGWCIHNEENANQYKNVLKELQNNPMSRRASMIYTRPTMHQDYNQDGKNDFICTNVVQYYIRDNKLEVVVQMRSNDVIFGYKNDRAWQVNVQARLAEDLEIEVGDIIWCVANIHIYPKYRYLIK